MLPAFLLLGGAMALWFWLDRRWVAGRLKDWAGREGIAILERERRYLWRKGPFGFTRSSVFRVKARDAEGRERTGWIRLATTDFFTNEGEVRWDEPS